MVLGIKKITTVAGCTYLEKMFICMRWQCWEEKYSLNYYKSQLFGLNMWDINKKMDFYNNEHSTTKVKICSALLHAHNQDIEYS